MPPNTMVVSKLVNAVGFSFYSDEEVRKISVKKITAPILLDTLNRPVPGGLYDPALGPLDQTGSCVKCGEEFIHLTDKKDYFCSFYVPYRLIHVQNVIFLDNYYCLQVQI